MKNIIFIILIFIAAICKGQTSDSEKIVAANPVLKGTWTGEGKFLNVDFNEKYGPVEFNIRIGDDNLVSGNIGEALLQKTSIAKAEYGYEIRGILVSKIKKDKDLKKDHVIILMAFPEDNITNVKISKSDFHIKNNYFFDFFMRVGNVDLVKKNAD
jgi:hypothetical protein